MATVLARKQAEPLIAELVYIASQLRAIVEEGGEVPNEMLTYVNGPTEPSPVARLKQCLVEEAEAAPETLTAALQLIAFFSSGFPSNEILRTLSRGPYGVELLHQTWLLYATMQWPQHIEILDTFASLAPLRNGTSQESGAWLELLLHSMSREEIAHGLFACAGLLQREEHHHRRETSAKLLLSNAGLIEDIKRHLYIDDPALHLAAAYTLAHIWVRGKHQKELHNVSSSDLDRLLMLRLHSTHQIVSLWSSIALCMQIGLQRSKWVPVLTVAESMKIRIAIESPERQYKLNGYFALGNLMIAFHAGTVFSEDELAEHLTNAKKFSIPELPDALAHMLKQMGEVGNKHLKALKKEKRNINEK